jgi:hypothetical protein
MTEPHAADLLAPDLDHLARQVVAHFEREAIFLDSLCDQLRNIHTALLDNNQPALYALLQDQSDLEDRQQTLGQERAGLCRRAAAVLGIAVADVQLRRLAEQLRGEPAQQLEGLRQRLEIRLEEADQVRQRIASLAHCCLSFLQRFFLDLTGADAGCYSPTGSHSAMACGSFIEVRG